MTKTMTKTIEEVREFLLKKIKDDNELFTVHNFIVELLKFIDSEKDNENS